jgi:hypothetical protein
MPDAPNAQPLIMLLVAVLAMPETGKELEARS